MALFMTLTCHHGFLAALVSLIFKSMAIAIMGHLTMQLAQREVLRVKWRNRS